MASSLLALIDDIATVLDDVAVLTKVAAKKTTGVLGDDLAPECTTGHRGHGRPRTARGLGGWERLIQNKAILVPAAMLDQRTGPWLITLADAGGAFCV